MKDGVIVSPTLQKSSSFAKIEQEMLSKLYGFEKSYCALC